MDKISEYDAVFENFLQHIPELIPEGVIEIDLKLLQKFDLLREEVQNGPTQSLTQFFHVIESQEKITLFNDQFVIWIVPEKINEIPTTLVLISIHQDSKLHLEMAFAISGIYNTSRLVLRVLEKYLMEIQENEDVISHLENPES